MTDVLVVGGGLAAVAAALEAAGAGASVLLVAAGGGSSELAQGGIAAAVAPGDAPALHEADTVAAGAGLCDPSAVRLLAAEAPGAVAWLEASGVAFDREADGSAALGLEAAHSRARVLHAGGDASGAAIMAAVRRGLALAGGATRLQGRLEGLLLRGDRVVGAHFAHRGGLFDVPARAVVLATGGFAGLYPRSTTSPLCDGSGLLAALAAGAELADLEMVQFHPTAYAGPGPTFLLTEALRGAGARLVDRAGRRFLDEADPRGELAPRAVVSRAIAERLRHDPSVLLDARPIGPLLPVRFPGFVARCRQVGLDPLRELVPVAPAAHYTMGGVVTDLDGRTAVPGLLAAGECARTGVHGANRLASNSLLEAVVFGRRAARAALSDAAPAPRGPVRTTPSPAAASVAEQRAALDRGAGPLRSVEGLQNELRRLAAAPAGLAGLVLRAALLRAESRGAHVRTDRPDEDPAWAAVEVVVGLGAEGRPVVTARRRSAEAAMAS
jgi:L-aspartate oxidase